MPVKLLTQEQVQQNILKKSYPAQESYYGMYSTWWDGLITSPSLMQVPIDDHLVHRGDGVFEAIKVVNGRAYLLDEHLERLSFSADAIELPLPMDIDEIKRTLIEVVQLIAKKTVMLRLYISRGPGSFTTNPYESISSQMYLVVTEYNPPSAEKYQEGVNIGKSLIKPKAKQFAQIKSCNYLQNVLMKKESVDRNLDYTVGFDSSGFVTESGTENIIIVDKHNNLVRPKLENILKGTTMMRAFELAQKLEGKVASIAERDITESDIILAKEVMMVGTTIDILPVACYEHQPIEEGTPGRITKELMSLLRSDIECGPHTTEISFKG